MIERREISNWHDRFLQQARWTKDLRSYLLKGANQIPDQFILEVGCGTGIILKDLKNKSPFIFGLDINRDHLRKACIFEPEGRYTQGDAKNLPFPDSNFNLVISHFFLLWVDSPRTVIKEMVRVTKPGGKIMALAEPDYGGRIDYPNELAILGKWQSDSLRKQGADPNLGRKLSSLFHQAGLKSIQTGVLGGQWFDEPDWENWESEWQVINSDITQTTPKSDEFVAKLQSLDRSAYASGDRVLFVPTFFATGIV